MFVLNAYFCRELRFVAILRSKLRFLLINTAVDSDFTQNFWEKNWRLGALERENPEKHQTKQANEDDEQEDWTQKETFSVDVCQSWNRGDKVQLEDESGFRLCCELVILCTGKAAPLGKEGNIASDKVRWRKRLS